MLTYSDIQRCYQKRLLLVSSLFLLFSSNTLAQSGRRTAKPAVTPAPTIDETPVAKPFSGRQLTEKVSLIVAKQPSSKHLLSEEAITENVVKRLNELTKVTAVSAGDLNHDKAVKLAKSQTNATVVLLQFDVDEFQSGTIILNSPDLDVRVLIIAPASGQEKFKGKVYYKAVGGPMLKKDNWPNGTPIRITTEAVGIEAAEQVYDWLVVQEMNKRK